MLQVELPYLSSNPQGYHENHQNFHKTVHTKKYFPMSLASKDNLWIVLALVRHEDKPLTRIVPNPKLDVPAHGWSGPIGYVKVGHSIRCRAANVFFLQINKSACLYKIVTT
jgi:hypothetical protein